MSADTPEVTDDFLADVLVEADYQVRTRGSEDAVKSDDEWFWTLGWIAGKAVRPGTDLEKQRHRLRAAAALLLNWDRQLARRAGGFQVDLPNTPRAAP